MKTSVSEAAFLEGYDPSLYERPSVTVDVVLLTVREDALFTLVVRRAEHPFRGRWALPGGFVQITEPLDTAAERVLRTKCSLEQVYLEQLATFGAPERDPRMRVISVAYYALVDAKRFDASLERADEVTVARVSVPWEGETGGCAHLEGAAGKAMPLAFDHEDILGLAVKRIRGKLDYSPIGFQLLPERFTLLELQGVHEIVLGRALNKDSFRRRMLASGDLVATGEMQSGVGHRPAELYRFLERSAV
ncbi:MAG TPA: NUDIX domain-containing protein [Labilithrix sp.]|nr:NUDIX domain-containing protein [Labilithrix sp.]